MRLPFLVVSGRTSFTLINLINFTEQKLIVAPCTNIRCQQAFFFKKEEYGYCLHFTTKSAAADGYNLEDQKWYMLPFKPDFQEILENHQRLPHSSLKNMMNTASAMDMIKMSFKSTIKNHEMNNVEVENKFLTG